MARLTRVVSTSMIQPASGDHHRDFNRKIELTTSDVQFLCFDYSQVGLLFDKPKEIDVEHLKATFAQALDRLYPLAGRLTATQYDGDVETRSFSIICSGMGATFVHAEAVDNITVADILDPVVVPTKILDNLFLMTGVSNHVAVGSDLPLLAVQVTELTDAVFVAVTLSHCAADATTFWDFFNVWAELTRRDEAALSRRGSFHFSYESLDIPVRVPFYRSKLVSVGTVPPAPALQRKMLHFTKERIAKLKVKANTTEPKSSDTDREISSLQALMAHLWVCITRSRALNEKEKVTYMIAVGLRSRLQPPLPDTYVGNAILTTTVTSTVGELLGHGMGWAARQINKAIAAQTAEEARRFFYDRAKGCPPPVQFAELPPNTLITGGSPWFNVFSIDFGWGKPRAMRNGSAQTVEGRLVVSPGAIEGNIDFEATLRPETFRALACDPEFLKYF